MARSKARRPGGPTQPAEPEAASKAVEGEAAGPPAGIDARRPPAAAGNGRSALPQAGPGTRVEGPELPRAGAPASVAGSAPPSAGRPAAPTGAAGAAPGGGGKPPEVGLRRDEPPRAPGAASPPARSSAAFLWGLAGGVIGGILAALAAIHLLPPAGDLALVRSQVTEQAATVDQVRGRLEALEGADAAMRERVAALETAADARPEPDAMAGRLADADARLAALEDQVAGLGAGGDGAGQVAALQDEIAQLSATVGELQRGLGSADPGEVAQREQRLDQAARAAERVAALAGSLDTLADRVAASETQTGQVATDIAALSGQVKLLDERAETLAAEVGALGSRATSIEDRITAGGDVGGRAAALALLAGQVAAAVEQGEPYQAPLESLRALGAEDPVVGEAAAGLAASAPAGVPTLEQLRQSFGSTAGAIVQSAEAPAGDGMLERAAGSLMRLVTIRPVGADAEGDHAAARVARAEARLADGDLAGAVAELEGLEGAPAEAAAPWLEQARARLAAQDALDRLHAHATDLLAQPR